MQHEARRRGSRFLLFVHSDASFDPDGIEGLLQFARRQEGRWGVIFTNYDSLCCFNMEAVADVGCWDETFDWYVSDIDYYNRMKWRGWEQRVYPDLPVSHRVSQTLQAMPPSQRDLVRADAAWAERHYEHKWGGSFRQGAGRPERYKIPYNGRPEMPAGGVRKGRWFAPGGSAFRAGLAGSAACSTCGPCGAGTAAPGRWRGEQDVVL